MVYIPPLAQLHISNEDLRMMMEEVVGRGGSGRVDWDTYLSIVGRSPWY